MLGAQEEFCSCVWGGAVGTTAEGSCYVQGTLQVFRWLQPSLLLPSAFLGAEGLQE